MSFSAAETTFATPTDIDYVMGPLDIVDGAEEEEFETKPYVYIDIVSPKQVIKLGEYITIRCHIVGCDVEDCYIQWQYCTDLENDTYHDIDCHDIDYVFQSTKDNIRYYYRVVVTY